MGNSWCSFLVFLQSRIQIMHACAPTLSWFPLSLILLTSCKLWTRQSVEIRFGSASWNSFHVHSLTALSGMHDADKIWFNHGTTKWIMWLPKQQLGVIRFDRQRAVLHNWAKVVHDPTTKCNLLQTRVKSPSTDPFNSPSFTQWNWKQFEVFLVEGYLYSVILFTTVVVSCNHTIIVHHCFEDIPGGVNHRTKSILSLFSM